MNRLSFLYPTRRPCRTAALFLLFALPGAAFAQKPVPAPPTAAASFPDPVTPPAPSQKVMLMQDSRLDRPVTLDIISVPLGEVLEGRLPASALSPSHLAQVVSLQPLLPAVLQRFPPASVSLGLLSDRRISSRVVFREFSSMRLEVSTPPAPAP